MLQTKIAKTNAWVKMWFTMTITITIYLVQFHIITITISYGFYDIAHE